ncbi:hypothetical protein P3T18_005389 [Paraburkholderia sp. GAS199]|uniref:hypothetical protein n=1 Tax=Paraburkholderia sp. GAS199 TaxID=3035126 RepID=UPI003D2561D7
MSIIRAPRPQSNFYLLDKKISEDSRLSWASRGMLIFLLGKPDHWRVSVQALVNETAEAAMPSKRDAVYRVLGELQAVGYITRSQSKGNGGTFGGVDYLVSEFPVDPLTENTEAAPLPDSPLPAQPYAVQPDTDEPHTVKPTQVSTDSKQGFIVASIESSNGGPAGSLDLFGDAQPTAPEKKTAAPTAKKTKSEAFDVKSILLAAGVDEQVAIDWLALRKRKRADVTPTTIDGAKEEAHKAAMTLNDFLREWCVRGSQGLKAEWIKGNSGAAQRDGFMTPQERNRAISAENERAFLADMGMHHSNDPFTVEMEH